MDNIEIERAIKKTLDKQRYEHTLGVMYTSAALAMCHGYDMESAITAGLLHDCAKAIPNSEKVSLCKKYNISYTEIEEKNPGLLHAKLAEYMAQEMYGVSDTNILSAIRFHTTGRPDMNLLEKIVFIADYIEPHRDTAPNLIQIRKMAFSDINKCICYITRDTLTYLRENHIPIDTLTEETYRFYSIYEDTLSE